MPRDARCKRCVLHGGTDYVCLWGVGPKRAKIMLVGEAPGEEEERDGVPFIGQAGKLLDGFLRDVGLKRKDVYVTNANKCRPPNNRTPVAEEVAACLPFLAEEIEAVQPEVIVCVGGNALKAVTGIATPIKANRGKILGSGKLRTAAKIIVTYHPAAMLHDGSRRAIMSEQIREDLRFAMSLTSESSSLPEEVRTLVHTGEYDKLIDALTTVRDAKVLVADCEWLASHETKDLIWPWDTRSQFLSLAFSTMVNGKVHSIGIEWDPDYFKPLQAFMRSRSFVFHNAMADLIWLFALGFEVQLAGDTLILAYLLDEEQRLALDQLAPLIAGVEPGWKKPVWRERPRGKQVLELLNYNCDDTYATECLRHALSKRANALPKDQRANIHRSYTRVLLPAVPTFARIALKGVGIDVKRLEEVIEWRKDELRKTEERIADIADVPIRTARSLAGSPQQTSNFMRGSYGLELPNSTKQELGRYAADYPIIEQIRNFRHERKLLGTYLQPWRRLIDKQRDGRIHSIYRLANSRTGRTSAELAEGGSLQLAPREEWLRQLVEARQDELGEEWEVLAADYSQIELRMIAWLAPEHTMRRLFDEGTDLHATTAAYVKAQLPLSEFWPRRDEFIAQVTKAERQAGKSNNFGFVFGMQAEHYVDYAWESYKVRMTLDQAVQSRNGFMELYYDIPTWHDRIAANEFQQQLTLTPTGRYRRNFKSPTEAINTPIQTTASDLTLFAMTCIEEELYRQELFPHDAFLTGFVHDSVLLEVRKDVAEDVKAIVKQTMEHPDLERIGIKEIPVPLVADVKTGPNWGDAS